MEEKSQFSDGLEQTLEQHKKHLDQTQLPKIKERFETFYGNYKNFYNVLLRKSMIKEDPYKGEQKISEIELPPDTEVSEIEKDDQIGLRLSMFDDQLSFLLSYYHFSVDYLSLKRIKLLAGLTKFINWHNLATSSPRVNTRHLAVMVGKVRGGSDTFSIQVLNSAQGQLTSIGNEIMKSLKDLTLHHRERYKLEVRRGVIDLMDISPEAAVAINSARKKRRKVIAVGTSTVRAIETVAVSGFQVSPKRGWTDKFIYPPNKFQMIDAMITNFHQPQSTLLMMVSAFAGLDLILKAYKEAKKKDYRFLSYGDAMLIL